MEQSVDIYKSLARMFLPYDMLDYFDVSGFEEELTGGTILNGSYPEKVLHIRLDESDWQHHGDAGYRPNGFAEETRVDDFPVRDRKCILHVRRRRWLTPDGRSEVLDYGELLGAKGTRLSRDFAAFLKECP